MDNTAHIYYGGFMEGKEEEAREIAAMVVHVCMSATATLTSGLPISSW